MKWVKSLESYTFVIDHNLGKMNKVVDVLSRRVALLNTSTIHIRGLEWVETISNIDKDFQDAWKELIEPQSIEKTPYLYYFV